MGYEIDRIINLQNFDAEPMLCTECDLVMRRPCKCNECDNHFCYECIKKTFDQTN